MENGDIRRRKSIVEGTDQKKSLYDVFWKRKACIVSTRSLVYFPRIYLFSDRESVKYSRGPQR